MSGGERIETCPVCRAEVSEARLPYGWVYCRRGHVITVAPIDAIDLRTLETLAVELGGKPIASAESSTSERASIADVAVRGLWALATVLYRLGEVLWSGYNVANTASGKVNDVGSRLLDAQERRANR